MPLYNGLFFFVIVGCLLVPAIFLGINEKKIKYYGLFVTIVILTLVFADNKIQSLLLVGVYLLELLTTKSYFNLRKRFNQRWILWIMLIISISPLVLIKILHPTYSFIKLLGISYLTFRVVEILIEIYDGLIKEITVFEFTYFILFFPSLSSGPIDRFRRFKKDLDANFSTEEYIECCKTGIYKLFLGLAYKYIFASIIFNYWLDKIPKNHNLVNSLNYMYGYTLYIFFDFAGYSLMAIGLSYILGIKCPDNFNKPFISKDVKDFWNRWHMSLSFWFRDYVYTRFVMASKRGRWFKNRYTGSYIAYGITMGLMGIWHGNEIYYIIYGFYHAFLLIFTDYFDRHCKAYRNFKNTKIGTAVSIFITINLISFGMLLFSGYLF